MSTRQTSPSRRPPPPARQTSPARRPPPPARQTSPAMEADEDTSVFVFYSKSAHASPGKGAGEYLAPKDYDRFKQLAKIPQWRRMLSNFWMHPIRIDGLTWASVEHYYQGSKFKINNPEFYRQFSVQSGSEISKDPALAKAAGGKSGKRAGVTVRPSYIKADPDFFLGRDVEEMNLAQDVKFQDKDLSDMLQMTGDAILMHNMQRGKLIRFTHLENIRSSL